MSLPRRLVSLALAFASLAALVVSPAAADTIVRIAAANITSGNLQSYDPGHGTRIFQGLQADVVLIQEFNFGDNSASAIRSWVNTAFGTEFAYYREAGAQIPNGIVSRYPILASGEWDDTSVSNRDFAWARIDLPGDKDLWAISVHFLTSSASVRNTEATQLRSFINANVPAASYLVIGGDFNTDSRSESALATLSSIVVTGSPYPADQNNNTNTNAARAKPYDWLLADTDLHATRTGLVIGTATYPNGLVFDSRVFTPLSAVAPVLSTDSAATNMQHMAVVRDFRIPDGTGGGGGGTTPVTLLNVSSSVAQGAWRNYSVTITSAHTKLAITMTGTGDGDLYVRKGSQPTTSTYDFRPYLDGTAESVTVSTATTPALSAGTWYISVHGYTAATFTLTATVE